MRFGSVCSGIEAASVAWHPLGWRAAWLSEIEPFPSAVLKHHYPDVPNLGDMTTLPERILSGEVEAPDVFCGGTPCQAFSVAGLRKSLEDARGNLSLTFVGIANAIDHVRSVRSDAPAIIFWENVPGVLSTADNAFGCFLGALAGEDEPIIPSGGKWTNAGCVYGPQRAVAWRVLDAQYFGVAQRRRRVFVVASAREGFDPAAVLFEFDGVRRDIAPSREARKEVTERAGTLTANGGGLNRPAGNANELDFCVTVAQCLTAGSGQRYDPETETILPVSYAIQGSMIGRNDQAGPQGDGINEEVCFTQNCVDRHGVAYGIRTANTSSNGWGIQEEATHTLDRAMGVAVAQPVAYSFDSLSSNSMKSSNPHSGCRQVDLAKTLDTTTPEPSKNQGGIAVAHPVAFTTEQTPKFNEDCALTLTKQSPTGGGQPQAVMQPIGAFKSGQGAQSRSIGWDENVSPTLPSNAGGNTTPALLHAMQVRRLTPIECERLQGFPDNYTNIPWRNKPESPDGPRYKALGNSWAVPVVRWIGQRIHKAVNP